MIIGVDNFAKTIFRRIASTCEEALLFSSWSLDVAAAGVVVCEGAPFEPMSMGFAFLTNLKEFAV